MKRIVSLLLCAGLVLAPGGRAGAIPNAAPAARTHHRVLVLGDSVLSALRWMPDARRPLWRHGYDIILETWGCQSLLAPGCPGSGGKSAVERLIDHSDDDFDAVVVGTGYNDTSTTDLRRAIRLVTREARRHGAGVVWLTYERRPTIMIKSRLFNAALRSEAARHPTLTVADWAARCRGHDEWFNADGVHLVRAGGMQLGRFLAASLDRHFARING